MSIEHTVAFTLIHAADAPEHEAFLVDATRILSAIPGVQDFRVRDQVSPKSPLKLQFSMVFDDVAAFKAYDAHPDHVAFVAERWIPEVADFQELDLADR